MTANPVSAKERVHLLDVLRGFAILGMFAVNMTVDMWGPLTRSAELALPDFITLVFVDFFGQKKFLTIFSFLFGLGFFIQMERFRARGSNHVALYVRRSVGLFLIGTLAIAFTLPAEILNDYATYGLALLLFYKRSPRTILAIAALVFLLGSIAEIVPQYHAHLELETLAAEQGVPVSELPQPVNPVRESWKAWLAGDFLQISSEGLAGVWDRFNPSAWYRYMGNLGFLGLMLLGLYVGRRGAVWNADVRKTIASKALPWLIGVGISGSLLWVAMEDFDIGDSSSLVHTIIQMLAYWPIMIALGLGYAAAITLLIEKDGWRRRLTPFAAVGRMGLTNYLFTDLVAAFIGFSWGLGLYAKILPATGLAIAIGVFFFQVLASNWWMKRFRFGPAEWLWRSFTYGKLQPMRTQHVADA